MAVDLEMALGLELALGMRPGTLLVAAGYLDPAFLRTAEAASGPGIG